MKAYTRRRLSASAKLGLASMLMLVALTIVRGQAIVPGRFLLGFGLGATVGIAELFVLRNWLRSSPFVLHILVKSLVIVFVMYATFALLDLLDVVTGVKTWTVYLKNLGSASLLVGELQMFGVIVFLIFFVHLDRLLGPGVLLGYVTGRYHHPRRERRIFMFLDLKGSTTLADSMEAEQYFGFLHRYFTSMSEPILETGAEIYQYVGDEVVLTWKVRSGIEDASCIRLFFLVEDQVRADGDDFMRTYGVVPEFKAGLHAGDVITAQIGELKSEIVYNGDVLNTAARIQALCNELDERLLVSRSLVEELKLGPEFAIRDIGPVQIRGKDGAVELCAVRRASENVKMN